MAHAPTPIKKVISRQEIDVMLREVIYENTGIAPKDIIQNEILGDNLGVDEFTRTCIIGKLELIYGVRLLDCIFTHARTIKHIGDAIFNAQSARRDDELLDLFSRTYKEVTGIESIQITVRTGLRIDLKIDNFTMDQIAQALHEKLGIEVSWRVLCEFRHVHDIIGYLRGRLNS